MPRRNENARPRRPALDHPWRMAEVRAMSEHVDRKVGAYGHTPVQQKAQIKTTGEQIVRDHRNSVADLIQTPSIQKVYSAPWYKAIEWNWVINRACWAALIGCLIYLGIIVFAPFTAKLLR